MKVYTYSQARQKLANLLDEAREKGKVQIKRRDGQVFTVKPVKKKKSPFEVDGVSTGISLKEINETIRESRERTKER